MAIDREKDTTDNLIEWLNEEYGLCEDNQPGITNAIYLTLKNNSRKAIEEYKKYAD